MQKLAIGLFLLLVVFSVASPRRIFAQVVINEVSPASTPEWVEIYNLGTDVVSLQGYSINYGDDSQTERFCDNDQISGNSYRVIISSTKLNNSGDTVILRNSSGIVDTISYGPGTNLTKPSGTQSLSRVPDGSSNWTISETQSQQGDQVSFACPTATPTPTSNPTSTPTSTPTTNPTLTPTPAPLKTKTPTPKPSINPSSTPSASPQVLGATDSPTVAPSSTEKDKSNNPSVPILPIVLIGLGTISIAIALFPFLKNFYLTRVKGYNETHDKTS